jgi:hypothetical protein
MPVTLILILKRFIAMRNTILFMWRKSRLKTFGTLLFIGLSLVLVYVALWQGLQFIVSLGGLGIVIIKKIIFILFLVLFFMVAVSFATLFYSAAIKSKETRFLLSLPLKFKDILFYKFCEVLLLSSWIPLAGIVFFFFAYAQVGGVNFVLPLVSCLYTVPFLIITCFFGFIMILLVARFFNLKLFFAALLLGLGVFFIFYAQNNNATTDKSIFYFLSQDVAFLGFSKTWFLPFSWAGYGLSYLQQNDFGKAAVHLLSLWSLAGLCCSYVPNATALFRGAYQRQFLSSTKERKGGDYAATAINRLRFLPLSVRAFILKDIRIFSRQPNLWMQLLIFFGILFFYFLNFHRLSYHTLEPIWKNALTFLNVFSILAIVSSMGIRFVFPQWSLEGRNFWILKLSPVSLKKVFFEKLIFSTVILFVLAESLVLLSTYMLDLNVFFLKLVVYISSLACISLIAISLGLGAYFADFKQVYYLKAVESLGGFITFIVNFSYVCLTIFLFASITHLYFLQRLTDFYGTLRVALILWTIFSLVIAVFVSIFGIRRLQYKEY